MQMLPGAELADGDCAGVIDGFHQQPATRFECVDHSAQGLGAMGHMHEHEPGVDEVERFQGRLIMRYIVETDLDVRARSLTSPRQVNRHYRV